MSNTPCTDAFFAAVRFVVEKNSFRTKVEITTDEGDAYGFAGELVWHDGDGKLNILSVHQIYNDDAILIPGVVEYLYSVSTRNSCRYEAAVTSLEDVKFGANAFN